LKSLSLATLRRYDVGRARPGSASAARYPARQDMDGVRIPTLAELLAALRAASGRRRWIYVEIKTDPQDRANSPAPASMVDAVFDDLEGADYLAHAKIIAFDWQVLRLTRARNARIATAHLTIPPALLGGIKLDRDGRSPWLDGSDPQDHGGSPLAAIRSHGGEEWSPHFSEVATDRMDEARALGLRVGPWGLAKGEDIARMAALGLYSATVSGPDWTA